MRSRAQTRVLDEAHDWRELNSRSNRDSYTWVSTCVRMILDEQRRARSTAAVKPPSACGLLTRNTRTLTSTDTLFIRMPVWCWNTQQLAQVFSPPTKVSVQLFPDLPLAARVHRVAYISAFTGWLQLSNSLVRPHNPRLRQRPAFECQHSDETYPRFRITHQSLKCTSLASFSTSSAFHSEVLEDGPPIIPR